MFFFIIYEQLSAMKDLLLCDPGGGRLFGGRTLVVVPFPNDDTTREAHPI